jgi:hypothetical protein
VFGLVASVSSLVLLMVGPASGQGAWPAGARPAPAVGRPGTAGGAAAERPAREEEAVRVRKISGLGAAAKVQTPEYRSTVARGAKPPKDRVQITVSYDTRPEWIDELMFRYYALAYKEEKGKKSYSLYKNTERCLDIQEGRGHLSVMYLRPAALERHGELVAVAVEIVYQGKVAADISETSAGIPENWWKNAEVTDSALVTTRDGYLVERTRSPFAFINTSEYEYAPY